MPEIPDCKTRVYLDIEGLPDREHYYLIGALIITEHAGCDIEEVGGQKSKQL
jgi:hypothetical protein